MIAKLVNKFWYGHVERIEKVGKKDYVILQLFQVATKGGYEEIPVPLDWFDEEPQIGQSVEYRTTIES